MSWNCFERLKLSSTNNKIKKLKNTYCWEMWIIIKQTLGSSKTIWKRFPKNNRLLILGKSNIKKDADENNKYNEEKIIKMKEYYEG